MKKPFSKAIRYYEMYVRRFLDQFGKVFSFPFYFPGKKVILQYPFLKLHNLFSHYLARFHSIFLTFVTLSGLEAAEGKHH